MRRYIAIFTFLLLAGFGVLYAISTEAPAGDAADTNTILQEAEFTDLNGNALTMADFQGKTVLIDIWETWCTPCIRSMPTLQKLMDDYPDDFIVLAVSPGYMDSPEDVRQFVDNNDYDFQFVFGQDFSNALQVQSLPYKVYVNPSGEYVTTVLGSHGPEADYEKTREIIEQHL
ncbi:TlpA disulfide reductase family protein [Balneolales bacterium ANBcel1]|nr:TlpA disulfide reductase family protein [Balneolales bacterium ANBcel1]